MFGKLWPGCLLGEGCSDGITSDLWRIFKTEAAPLLARLLTAIGRTGAVPAGFLDSVIVYIHKRGDKLESANYRPISLTQSAYRAWEGPEHPARHPGAGDHRPRADGLHGRAPDRREHPARPIDRVAAIRSRKDGPPRGLRLPQGL